MAEAAEGARTKAAPRVSVVIPCWNEGRFIRRCLETLLGGTWQDLEILVVDGMSRDRTRAEVAKVAAADPRVRLLDNPREVTPAALNIGVRAARGEIIVRADAHSTYPREFVAALVSALESTGADMVGACSRNVPVEDSAICRAIVCAINSPFGTGSRFRYRRQSGPVDAVQLGCWRRETFARVGLFDERLLRNQDNEHSARILARGGRVHMTADAVIDYYPRSSLDKLCKHGVANGTWNAFTEALHPYTFRWRHFLPALFFLGACGAFLAFLVGAYGGIGWMRALAVAAVAPYIIANLIASVAAARAERSLALAPLVAAVLAAYHFSYGYGIVKGWLLVATGGWRSRLGGGSQEARLR